MMTSLFEKRLYSSADGQQLPYRLFLPEGYDASQRYPLVLFLHGAGERGSENERQLTVGPELFRRLTQRPCIVVVPQCPEPTQEGQIGFRWVETDWASKAPHAFSEAPSLPMRLVLELLELIGGEFSIDPGRRYVTGISMGGFGTWDLICRRPHYFAAAVPICGGACDSQAETIAHLPIWTFHGTDDTVVWPERTRSMVDALRQAGGSPRYTEYPGIGHGSWDPAYVEPELMDWLFAQKRG